MEWLPESGVRLSANSVLQSASFAVTGKKGFRADDHTTKPIILQKLSLAKLGLASKTLSLFPTTNWQITLKSLTHSSLNEQFNSRTDWAGIYFV